MSATAADIRLAGAIRAHRDGRREEAETLYRATLRDRADDPDALRLLGELLGARAPAEAAALLRRAVAAAPGFAPQHHALGTFLLAAGREAEAVAPLEAACRLDGANAASHANLGSALLATGRFAEAASCFAHAIERRPGLVSARRGAALAAAALDRYDEAEEIFAGLEADGALTADDRLDRSNVLKALGRRGEAEALLRAVLSTAEGRRRDRARFRLAHLLLEEGRWTEAWPHYEARSHLRRDSNEIAGPGVPRWSGASDRNRRVLLVHEAGFGDTIQFSRFIPAVAARARVAVAVPWALVRLLAAMPEVEAVWTPEATGRRDADASFMALPGVFGTTQATVPAPEGWLHADPFEVERWRLDLADDEAELAVGLAWASGQHGDTLDARELERRRSVPLAALAPLAAVPGVRLVSLVVDERRGAIASCGFPVRDTAAGIADFFDTAALLAALDVVVTVDTAVAHLAGALGRPVFLLDRQGADWRWGEDGRTTPWYRSVRVFRQSVPGAWDEPVRQVAAALAAFPRERVRARPDPRLRAAWEAERRGDAEAAASLHRAVLAEAPANAWALASLAADANRRGDAEEAVRLGRAAVAAMPEALAPRHVLGAALVAAGAHAEARALLEPVLARDPGRAMSLLNLGVALKQLGLREDAIARHREALAAAPELLLAWRNLAELLLEAKQHEEAAEAAAIATRLAPDDERMRLVEGYALRMLGRFEAAETVLRAATAHLPESLPLRFSLACLVLLRQGPHPEGWALFEARRTVPIPLGGGRTTTIEAHRPAGLAPREWNGAADPACRLVLWHEQGFGDTLQFCRFVAAAARRAQVILALPRPLHRLLGALEGVAAVVDPEALPPHDAHLPMMSLPRVLAMTGTGPAGPYLGADAAAVAAWRRRLDDGRALAGLVWAGQRRADFPGAVELDSWRSVPLTRLAPLLATPGIRFVSLQKGEPRAELAEAALALEDPTDELADFRDTAALVAALDVVVTVDTAVAHLAGALGTPVFMLNRRDTDWRWGIEGGRTPWYRSFRIFRQATHGDWDPVIAEVGAALAGRAWTG